MAVQLCKHCDTDIPTDLKKYFKSTVNQFWKILNRRLHEITKLNATLVQTGNDSKDDDGITDVDGPKDDDGIKDEDCP